MAQTSLLISERTRSPRRQAVSTKELSRNNFPIWISFFIPEGCQQLAGG